MSYLETSDHELIITDAEGATLLEVVENAHLIETGGDVGPPGPPGPSGIGGVEVVLENPRPGDVLSYNGAAFVNRDQRDLVDGGNF